MIEEFRLTLLPETESLTSSARETHLAWRRETLQRVQRARIGAESLRLLRWVLTLGLWWR